jgi:calcineurin-like phosphoesterase family protein
MFNIVYSKTFKTKEEYIGRTVSMFNKIVNPEDITIFLGDIGETDIVEEVIKRLNGKKVLLMGNHDSFSKSKAIDMGFDEVYDTPVFYNERLVFSHEPIPVEPGILNVHGHTHQIKLKSDWHLNLCPEWWNYRPVSIKMIQKDYIFNKPKPERKFLKEWYKDIQLSFQDNSSERFNLNEDGTIHSLKVRIEEVKNECLVTE